MPNLLALLSILVAGIAGGSYAMPTKHIKWPEANLWLAFAVVGLLLVPMLFAVIFVPNLLTIYRAAPYNWLGVLVLGGMGFGLGQICFPFGLARIGLGLSFAISLGLSTGLGFLLPMLLQSPEKLVTLFGAITSIGIICALVGIAVMGYAGFLREQHKAHLSKRDYILGVILIIGSGLSTASQNFVFTYTSGLQDIALQHGVSLLGTANIVWPLYSASACVVFAGYFAYLVFRHQSFGLHRQPYFWRNSCYIVVMGVLFFTSLAMYCRGAQAMGRLGPVVGWPLFMIAIIVTSNFWSSYHKEWVGVTKRIRNLNWLGLVMLLGAVIILGLGLALE